MAEQENNNQQEQEDITDLEIAELANKEIRKREDEIAKLKKELAQEKLYSNSNDAEEAEVMDSDECRKVLADPQTSDYDWINAAVVLAENEIAAGNHNPFGKNNGNDVLAYLKGVLEECDGDKNRVLSVYQSHLAADDPSVAMAYNKRKI